MTPQSIRDAIWRALALTFLAFLTLAAIASGAVQVVRDRGWVDYRGGHP
jgi:hypothetical protein